MTEYPQSPAMAALRRLRRAAWWQGSADDIAEPMGQLIEPLGHLEHAWHGLNRAMAHHIDKPTPETWSTVCVHLSHLDMALAVFHGPSGWEPQAVRARPGRRTAPRSPTSE